MRIEPWLLLALGAWLLPACADDHPGGGDGAVEDGLDAADGEDGTDVGDGADGAEDADEVEDGVGESGGEDAADESADGADGEDAGCPTPGSFDYTCEAGVPESCPGGICLLGMCLAPVLDPERWAECGDGTCGPCEDGAGCPADCGAPPSFQGQKVFDATGTTITVWAHGFYNKSPDEIASMVYGEAGSCSGILGRFADLGVTRPCGAAEPGASAPDQLAKVEYYGGVPAAWLSPEDVAEIEQYPYTGPTALDRYARILAKFIRHRLTTSGATHVNLACHSMGCLVTRHMLEHDLEGLASENRFVRWWSSAGVLAGARLARLYDNPTVQEWAPRLGLELSDFVVMHPDFVQDHTCVWDHRLREANSPYLGGMILHHSGATDPHIQEALGLALLDLDNPEDEPNDGIMFTADERFTRQRPGIALIPPGRGPLEVPGSNLVYVDHMTLPETDASALLATAALFHRRQVRVTLASLELLDDRERTGLNGEQGLPPAEIAAAVEVRYNPYVLDTFGLDVLVHQATVEQRSADLWVQDEGTTLDPEVTLYQGPLFDEMQSLWLDLELLEADWYPRFGVNEWAFDIHQTLGELATSVSLVDQDIPLQSEYVNAVIRVEVYDLY